MDVLGLVGQFGFSGVNSVLIVALFFILRSTWTETQHKVSILWDWHLIEVGKQKERKYNQEA